MNPVRNIAEWMLRRGITPRRCAVRHKLPHAHFAGVIYTYGVSVIILSVYWKGHPTT